jgi:hypothetical protein
VFWGLWHSESLFGIGVSEIVPSRIMYKIYALPLHHSDHTIYPPSCPGIFCDLPPKETSSAFNHAQSLRIKFSQSMVYWPGTAFQSQSIRLGGGERFMLNDKKTFYTRYQILKIMITNGNNVTRVKKIEGHVTYSQWNIRWMCLIDQGQSTW